MASRLQHCLGAYSAGVALLLSVGPIALADSESDWAKMKSITPRGYVCHWMDQPVVVDGRLDEKQWSKAAWTQEFQDIEGQRKAKPRFSTRAKMIWNDKYFYIGAVLNEPHVWGKLTKHDAVIFHDNDFEVFIDPDGDNHNYYEFEINALNTGWDLMLNRPYKNGGKADNSWEIPGLKTAIHVVGTLNDSTDTDRSWSVEIAIPWTVLAQHAGRPTPPTEGDQWRVNFSRVEWRHDLKDGVYVKRPGLREDNWVWSPQGIVDMHRPERWGYVQFSRRPPGSVAYAPDPSSLARETLLAVYHRAKAFHQKNKRWPAHLRQLDFAANQGPGLEQPIQFEPVADGFQADALIRVKGQQQRYRIRHDSKLWRIR